jgi:hypothetical protein
VSASERQDGYWLSMSSPHALVRAASAGAGQVLSAATRLAAARPSAKPLHPRGSVTRGQLRRLGGTENTGSAWLDRAGLDDVLVRQSRAIGLPAPVPDIFGLAIRVPVDDVRHGDLLFASTGRGRVTRYTLTAARTPHRRPMTTLLPYRTDAGPLLLSATWVDPMTAELSWAVRSGTWHHFADLALSDSAVDEPDALVSFDPMTNRVPGLEPYDWVQRLREPAYRTARRTRRD